MVLDPSILTNADGECPELNEQYKALVNLICDKLTDARVYVDGQDQLLRDRISNIEGDSDLADRLTQLQNLINTLDADGDGTLNELTGIQNEIDDLKARIAANEAAIARNTGDIANDSQRLSDYISTNNARVTNVEATSNNAETTSNNALNTANTANTKASEAKVQAAESKAVGAQNANHIDELKDRMDGLVSSEAVGELMNEAECRARKAVSTALSAAAAQLDLCAAFPSAPPVGNPAPPASEEVAPPVG